MSTACEKAHLQKMAEAMPSKHVLNRACWSPLTVSRQLLTIIVETFVQAGGTLELVIDETLEWR